jgi:hypothetical protein
VDPASFAEDNPHSLNRYAYGNNNPYRFTDPNGRFSIALAVLAVAGAALTVHELTSTPEPVPGHPDAISSSIGPVEAIAAIAAPLRLAFGATSIASSSAGAVNHRLRDPATGRFVKDPARPRSPHEFTDAQRRAEWRRLAEDSNSPLTAEQRAEIRARGWRGPQRANPKTGEPETMELSHEPVPLREGGTKVVPRWPADHAAVDPHRRVKEGSEGS